MQKTILMTAKLLIKQFNKCNFLSGGSDISGYYSYLGDYIIVHHFISQTGEITTRIIGNTCEIDISWPAWLIYSSGRVGLVQFCNRMNTAWKILPCCLPGQRTLCFVVHDPHEVKAIPRYENLETISISVPSYVNLKPFGNLPPFLKITTFVLVMFTLSFHFWKYSSRICIDFCSFAAECPNKTISSAYNKIQSLCIPIAIPSIPLMSSSNSRSLRYIEKRKGDKHSPCRTLILLKKYV